MAAKDHAHAIGAEERQATLDENGPGPRSVEADQHGRARDQVGQWRREFTRLTGAACTDEHGALDSTKLIAWQVKRGLAPTGRVRRAEIAAARGSHARDAEGDASDDEASSEAAPDGPAPDTDWIHYLRDLERFLGNQAAAERGQLLDLRANRSEHRIVGAMSEAVAGVAAGFQKVSAPGADIWDPVFAGLAEAHAALDREAPDVVVARHALSTALIAFREAHRRVFEYRSRVEGGAETAVKVLRGVEVGCDITLSILGAGVGGAGVDVLKLGVGGVFKLVAEQAAKTGILGTAVKVGAVAGIDRLAQGAGEAGAAAAQEADAEFDFGGVLAHAGEAAAMSFAGVLVGGALSKVFMRSLGEIIGSRLPPDAIIALANKYGVVGLVPPELFVSKGWRFLVGVIGDACTTTLMTAISTSVQQLRTAGRSPTGEQFAARVVEQLVENGLLQIVIGSLTHARIGGNQRIAIDFYRAAGYSERRIGDHIKGINLAKPVAIITITKGSIVSQFQGPGRPQGDYYSTPNYAPADLGIGPKALDRTSGQVVDKAITLYEVVRDVEVLKSNCSAPEDDWSIPENVQPTSGDGVQFFSANKAAFRPAASSEPQ